MYNVHRKQANSNFVKSLIRRKDYYKILDLPLSASRPDIKRRFRSLANRYHPDRNPSPSAAQKFIEVEKAYSSLHDAKKRRAYDFIRKRAAAAA
jgi:DnaJ-class molecular chaperone